MVSERIPIEILDGITRVILQLREESQKRLQERASDGFPVIFFSGMSIDGPRRIPGLNFKGNKKKQIAERIFGGAT